MNTKPTETNLLPRGSDAFVRLMQAITPHLPVRTCLTVINDALVAHGATPETLEMDEIAPVLNIMLPALERLCRASHIDEIRLDLSSVTANAKRSGTARRR